MRRTFLAQLALLGLAPPAAACFGETEPQPAPANRQGLGAAARLPHGPDLILLNGNIWTGDPVTKPGPREGFGPRIEAVAIVNGRFWVGGSSKEIRAYAGPDTKIVDLQGRFAVPGFIDSHVHFIDGGFQLFRLNLKDARDEAEFIRRVGEKARSLPEGRWILGGNWDEENWPSAKLPTRQLIDPVTPRHPVFISRYDGHAALANTLALERAGVTRQTPDPPGGVIVRDPASGEPTGVLKDAAMDLVARVIPRPTAAEMEEALKAALAEARRLGVTSVHNITMDTDTPGGSFADEIRLLRRAEQEGRLTCRFYEIVPIARWQRLAEAGVGRGIGSDFLKLGAVKGFADGSLGSRTAWMFEPFDDDPGNRGLPMEIMDPPSRMETLVRGADEADLQSCIHAIGDRGIAEMLDLFARVGGANPRARRFRIEHAQHVRSQDFRRFAELGIVASMQPYHASDDGRWAEKRIGRVRARSSYAWRSMLDAGASLAFGSDWPVAPLDPLLGINAAVTRATLDGKHPQGWIPEEKLSVDEALRAYTLGSAHAAFEEHEKGTISPGKLADLVALSDDIITIPPEEIRQARVVLTVVAGKVVFQRM